MIKVLAGLFHETVARVGSRFSRTRLVYQLSRPNFPPDDPTVTVHVFRQASEIPPGLSAQIHGGNQDQAALTNMRFGQNARLYVLTSAEGEFGSFFWVKSGADIPRLMIPLNPDDRVMFGAFTPRRLRGRHLFPLAAKKTCTDEPLGNARWLADCNAWNRPS